jgi:methionyl-tRNA formyltransferase
MQIDEGLDTGPVYLCEKTSIHAEETIPQLSERLADLGAELMVRTLSGMISGSLHPTPQDQSQASLAPILRKEDGYIDWRWSAQTIHNRVRAFNPWPGTVTLFRGSICRILKSKPGRILEVVKPPGSIIFSRASKGTVIVACGDGVGLELIEVQLPGKKPVSGSDFANGMRLQSGDCFELEVRQLS